jgi:O-antigen ligase
VSNPKKIIPTKLNILSLIVALTFFANISVFHLGLGSIYYGVMVLALLILMIMSKRIRIKAWFLLLIFCAFLSIYFNDIPSFFQPYQRFIIFVILLSLLSPFMTSVVFKKFRYSLLMKIAYINIAVVTFSFLGIASGYSLMSGRTGFSGFYGHSMILGPMSVISIYTCLFLSDYSKKMSSRYLLYLLAGFSFVACIAAGSRGAIVGGLFGGMVYYYKKNQGNLLKYIKVIFILISIIVITFPLWERYTELLVHKIEYSESNDSLIYTRESLWSGRISEFKESPIYGIGFSSVDVMSSHGLDTETGIIEPGSSWLAVLSMLGVMGVIPVVFIIFNYAFFLFKINKDLFRIGYISALYTFFIVHMTIEGYIFSAGAGLFLLFWLTVGNVDMFYTYYKKKKVFI